MNGEREEFTSEELQKTMEVPIAENKSPSKDIFDPWQLNTEGTSKEMLDTIAEILAKSKKMPQEITLFSNEQGESVKEDRPPTYEEMFPEDFIEKEETPAFEPAPAEEVLPEQEDVEEVLTEESQPAEKEPDFHKEELSQIVKDTADDIDATRVIEKLHDEKPEIQTAEDVDATLVVPTVAPAEKPEIIKREEAKGGRVWPPLLMSSLFLIVACFITLSVGIMPVIMQHGFARGMTQIIAPVITPGQPPEYTNVLLVGVDEDGYRTDTMMVATYNNETGKVSIMQLPRDTYVHNNGRYDKKLNSAYYTGLDQLKREVQIAYGIETHRFAAVNLDAFRQLIDAIGGVYMDVPINMIYDDPYQDFHIYLLKGPQTLNGDKAEQFVRFRQNNDGSGYPRGDLQRMQAQKDFIMATVKQMISMESIANLDELINIAEENIETNLSFDEIYNYAMAVLTSENFNVEFIETPGQAADLPGGSYFVVDYDGAREVAQKHFYATEETMADMKRIVVPDPVETKDEDTPSYRDEEEEKPVRRPADEDEPEEDEEPVEEPEYEEGSATSR